MDEAERPQALTREVRERGSAALEGSPSGAQSGEHPWLLRVDETVAKVGEDTVSRDEVCVAMDAAGSGASIGDVLRVAPAWISSARCAPAVLAQVGRVPAVSRSPMFSLALARRIARPPLVGRPATAFVRWYAAQQANFATEGEKVIYEKLTEKFRPTELHVEDVSGECHPCCESR